MPTPRPTWAPTLGPGEDNVVPLMGEAEEAAAEKGEVVDGEVCVLVEVEKEEVEAEDVGTVVVVIAVAELEEFVRCWRLKGAIAGDLAVERARAEATCPEGRCTVVDDVMTREIIYVCCQ